MLASNTTDWITAIGSSFAAIGTVSAVGFALWQVWRQDRRHLKVECRFALLALAEPPEKPFHAVELHGINVGRRSIRITEAYIAAAGGRRYFWSTFLPESDELPMTLGEGDHIRVFFDEDTLEMERVQDGHGPNLYAYFTDSLGNIYAAPFPGVKVQRKGWRLRKEYVAPNG